MTCQWTPDGLHLSLTAQEGARRLEEEKADPDVARLIIQTLVREVDLDRDETGVHGVRMILPAGL